MRIKRPIIVTANGAVVTAPFIWFSIGSLHFTLIRALLFIFSALCLVAVFKNRKDFPYTNYILILLALLIYGLITTIVLSGRSFEVLSGVYNFWFGAGVLLSILIIAFLTAPNITRKTLIIYYWSVVTLAVCSLLFNFAQLVQGERMAGLPQQPAVLAAILGVGFLLGFYFLTNDYRSPYLYVGQLLLLISILLTQTRGVVLPALVALAWYIVILIKNKKLHRYFKTLKFKISTFCLAILLIPLMYLGTSRAINLHKLLFAFSYRQDLIAHSLKIVDFMPPWGLGGGAISEWFLEVGPPPEAIMNTINNDFQLPSSAHNIFVDRLIEYGWLVMGCYIILSVLAFWQLWKSREHRFSKFLATALLFLILQLSVSVPRMEVELLFWIVVALSLLPVDKRLVHEQA